MVKCSLQFCIYLYIIFIIIKAFKYLKYISLLETLFEITNNYTQLQISWRVGKILSPSSSKNSVFDSSQNVIFEFFF